MADYTTITQHHFHHSCLYLTKTRQFAGPKILLTVHYTFQSSTLLQYFAEDTRNNGITKQWTVKERKAQVPNLYLTHMAPIFAN